MRFFAHDGKSTHGPAGIEELLKLPGFDGDTLVCPVGSDDSADWKPALAYPPFKKALLEAPVVFSAPPAPAPPAPVPAPAEPPRPSLPPLPSAASPAAVPPAPLPIPAPFPSIASPEPPAPALPPAPAAPAEPVAAKPKTIPCPSCAHANLEEARFCNACGARMDGRLQDISAPAPAAAPSLPPAPAPSPAVQAPPPGEVASTQFTVPPPAVAPAAPASAPPASPAAAPAEPAAAPAPSEPAPDAAFDPFAHLDPLLTYPTEPEPPREAPRRPLQPGKMGQLAAFEEPSPEPAAAAPALAPEPVAAAAPIWKRPSVLAAFASAAVVAGALGYYLLNQSVPAEPVAELSPGSAVMPEEPAPVPVAPADGAQATSPAPFAMPQATPSPTAMPSTPRLLKPAAKVAGPVSEFPPAPKKARKPRPKKVVKSAPKPERGDTMIESRPPAPKRAAKGRRAAKAAARAQPEKSGKDPLLEALLADATQAPAEAADSAPAASDLAAPSGEKPLPVIGQRPSAAAPKSFSLPGLQRPVSASDRAVRGAEPDFPLDNSAPSEPAAEPAAAPERAAPPPGIENEPAKAAEGDQLALVQVHEQFDFCAQLLAQGAFGDHYDTCLCRETREGAPYRGRRGFYATTMKKAADSGKLETSAKIISSQIDLGVATVKARWKSGGEDKGREVSQKWKLEDGLWCQAR